MGQSRKTEKEASQPGPDQLERGLGGSLSARRRGRNRLRGWFRPGVSLQPEDLPSGGLFGEAQAPSFPHICRSNSFIHARFYMKGIGAGLRSLLQPSRARRQQFLRALTYRESNLAHPVLRIRWGLIGKVTT